MAATTNSICKPVMTHCSVASVQVELNVFFQRESLFLSLDKLQML